MSTFAIASLLDVTYAVVIATVVVLEALVLCWRRCVWVARTTRHTFSWHHVHTLRLRLYTQLET